MTTHAAVDRFLAAIEAGAGIPSELYTDDAVVDATVPGWRYEVAGPDAIAANYGGWFNAPGQFEELERLTIADQEIVTYFLVWTEGGVPHGAHHCHQFRLSADGRISSDRVFCGGRWDAALLARMAEACDAR